METSRPGVLDARSSGISGDFDAESMIGGTYSGAPAVDRPGRPRDEAEGALEDSIADESRNGRRGPHGASIRPTPGFVRFELDEIEQSIPGRFEKQVRAHGDRLAVKTRRHTLSYADLNRWANRVAHALLAAGGTAPTPVALLLEKDTPLVAAILGALKAGKIYVPLSPSYPAARNQLILDDAQAPWIITDGANLATARRLVGASTSILNLDALDPGLDDSDPGLSIPPDAYAYILYTSGSTGRPKGTVEVHRNVLHNIRNFTNDHFVGPGDRVAGLSSFAFSGSLKEIYGALLNGGALLPLEIDQVGLHELARWLDAEEITIFSAVSTTFRHFAASLTGSDLFPRLRVIRIGSEEVTWKDVALFRARFSRGCVLVNGYGATETGTVRTYVIDHETPVTVGAVPIGYPVEGMELLLLDDEGRPVAENQVGQIAFRSAYLSAGYWRQPDLTRRAFLDDPDGGPRRTYLTGDLGVLGPGDCLVHAGRKDFQVKVRGYRVEVAEIETALRAAPGVAEAVVAARDELPEDRRLVAYVVPESAAVPATSRTLRDFLRGRLPDSSIPSTFVLLEALPLTPSGKVDRKGLPTPAFGRGARAGEFVAPRSMLEETLIAIWEELMEIRPLGVADDFFELGGNSLLAARLFAEIQKTIGQNLPLETLLTAPTIERMASILARSDESRSRPRPLLIALRAGGSRLPFFGIPGSTAHPLALYELSRHGDPEQPFFALQYPEPGPGGPYPERIEDLASRFLPEILKIQPRGPYRLGGHSFGGVVAFELAQQLVAHGHEVSLLALFDTWGKGYPAVRPFPGRLIDHLAYLRTLGFRQQLAYLSRKVAGGTARAVAALRSRAARSVSFDDAPTTPAPPSPDIGLINRLAWRRYQPRTYPGKLVLFRAERVPRWVGSRFDDPLLGWGQLAAQGVVAHAVRGDHLTLLDGTNVEPVARLLESYLSD
jgi:amino acid adenylation domain-containing protein